MGVFIFGKHSPAQPGRARYLREVVVAIDDRFGAGNVREDLADGGVRQLALELVFGGEGVGVVSRSQQTSVGRCSSCRDLDGARDVLGSLVLEVRDEVRRVAVDLGLAFGSRVVPLPDAVGALSVEDHLDAQLLAVESVLVDADADLLAVHHDCSLRAGYLEYLAGAVVALDFVFQGGSQRRWARRWRRRRAGRQARCEGRGAVERRGLALDGRRLGADAEVLALLLPQCRCCASGVGRSRRCATAVVGALACHLR